MWEAQVEGGHKGGGGQGIYKWARETQWVSQLLNYKHHEQEGHAEESVQGDNG